MKPFGFIVKLITIGIVWTLCFVTFWRSLIYAIWGFDVLFNKHWVFMWQMWQDGWVIDTLPEWMFLMALVLTLPLWMLGWFALMQIKFGKLVSKGVGVLLPKIKTFRKKYIGSRVLVITRKKSYLRTRPPALTYVMPIADDIVEARRHQRAGSKSAVKSKYDTDEFTDETEFNGASGEKDVFENDDYSGDKSLPFDGMLPSGDDDFYRKHTNNRIPEWNTTLPVKEEPKPISAEEKAKMLEEVKNEVKSIIADHGFEILENVKVGKAHIDILGVAREEMLSVVFDSENGDWLADEESIDKQIPLWFSESAHRPSPVALLSKAMRRIKSDLGLTKEAKTTNLLVIADGNVINADDMVETWDMAGVKVARAANGMPVSLPYILGMIPEAGQKPTKTFVKECKKVLKSDNSDNEDKAK